MNQELDDISVQQPNTAWWDIYHTLTNPNQIKILKIRSHIIHKAIFEVHGIIYRMYTNKLPTQEYIYLSLHPPRAELNDINPPKVHDYYVIEGEPDRITIIKTHKHRFKWDSGLSTTIFKVWDQYYRIDHATRRKPETLPQHITNAIAKIV